MPTLIVFAATSIVFGAVLAVAGLPALGGLVGGVVVVLVVRP